MHAVQPEFVSQTSPKALRHSTRRSARKHQLQRTQQRTRSAALEMSIKLVANGLLSICAASALVQILPQQRLAHDRFNQIQTEVKLTQERVDQEKNHFNRYFDPQQSKSIMQEQSNQVDPAQRPIVWLGEEELTPEEAKPPRTQYMGQQ